jgi:nicotinamidase/pyrazinamidase
MKTVFFDVDTQIDFLYPAGALYASGAEAVVDRIAALNRFAASRGIPVISTMDAHAEDDPEFRQWPPHCVAGTVGQHKPTATLLERRVTVPNRPDLPDIGRAQQILLEKQTINCFTNVNLTELLDRISPERCVVYGVFTEICVQHAAFGLLQTGRRVELVTDAVKEIDPLARDKMFAEFTSKGGILTNSPEITAAVYH